MVCFMCGIGMHIMAGTNYKLPKALEVYDLCAP